MHPDWSARLSKWLVDRTENHRCDVVSQYNRHLDFDLMSPDDRFQQQSKRLSELLKHAVQHVPFYQRIGITASEISASNAKEVLTQFPFIDRHAIQREPEAFIAINASALIEDATGGSTGTPLTFYVDRLTQQAREASLYWSDHLAGWRYGQRIAMLWGSDRDVSSALSKWRSGFRWWVDNRRWYNTFNMGPDMMEAYHIGMSRFQPHIIVSYAGSMATFARYLEQQGLRPQYPRTSIITSAEKLTREMRETIERVFPVSVFDRYGNREAGAIAAECAGHAGLHINEYDFFLERDVLPENGAGQLVMTYLRNKAMPLIRYRTGDLIEPIETRTCPCGWTGPSLSAVQGREVDLIKTESGRWVHGEYFTHLFYGQKGIVQFQFVQESLNEYTLLLKVDKKYTSLEDSVRAEIQEVIGDASHLEVKCVETIPTTQSGKHKFTISRLQDGA